MSNPTQFSVQEILNAAYDAPTNSLRTSSSVSLSAQPGSDTATAQANGAALTAALVAAAATGGTGTVSVTAPGTYYFAKPSGNADAAIQMVSLSGVQLVQAPGVNFKLANGANCYLLHMSSCTDCEIRGGTVDSNPDNNTVQGAWNVAWPGHTCWFEACTRCGVRQQRARSIRTTGTNIVKYAYLFNNFTDCYAHDLDFDTRADGVHLTGPGAGFKGTNYTGITRDNLVGITPQDYDSYAATSGNISDTHFDTLYANGNTQEIWRAAGTSTYTLKRNSVRNCFGTMGTGVSAVSVIDDNTVSPFLTNMPVYDLLIDNIRTATSATTPTVSWTGGAGKNVTIRNIHGGTKNVNIAVVSLLNASGSTPSVDSLTVDGITADPLYLGTGFAMSSTVTVKNLILKNIQLDSTTASSIGANIAGTLSRLTISDCQNNNGNSLLNFSSGLVSAVDISMSNCQIAGSGYVVSFNQSTGSGTCNFAVTGCNCGTGSYAFGNLGGTNTSPATVWAEGIRHPGTFFSRTTQSIRLISSSVKADGVYVTGGNAGDRFWNTSATFNGSSGAGFYINDGTRWMKQDRSPYTIANHFADAGNVTTGETDLYTDTLPAGQLNENGAKVYAEYGGTFVSSGTATRDVRVYFGGTAIFDTGPLTLSLSAAWTAFVTVIRVSSSVVRYAVSFTTEGAALAAYTSVGELTGLTLTNTEIVKVTGQAAGVGAATNDIVAKLGYLQYVPA